MLKNQQNTPSPNYFYAGFPYLDREDLTLTLETNIDKDILGGQIDRLDFIDETLLLGELLRTYMIKS